MLRMQDKVNGLKHQPDSQDRIARRSHANCRTERRKESPSVTTHSAIRGYVQFVQGIQYVGEADQKESVI